MSNDAAAQNEVQQNLTGQQKPNATGKWTFGLFSCFDDCESCLWASCLTPCAMGKAYEAIGKGDCVVGTLLNWFVPCYPCCCMVPAIKESKGVVEGSKCGDCCTAVCFPACFWTRTYREAMA